MNNIKVDLSKATIADYFGLFNNDTKGFLMFCDKVIEGGVLERGMNEMPAICSALTKALHENSEAVEITISSLLNYLKGDEGK